MNAYTSPVPDIVRCAYLDLVVTDRPLHVLSTSMSLDCTLRKKTTK